MRPWRLVVMVCGVAAFGSPMWGESLAVGSFRGAITQANGSFAGLCSGGQCDAVTGTLIYDRDLVPATGHVDIGPLEYEYGPNSPGPDVSFAEQFQIQVGPYFFDGNSGVHGDYPSFSFDDGVFDGIRLATTVQQRGDAYFSLQFSGANFTGAITDGYGNALGLNDLQGVIFPGLTDVVPYGSGGSAAAPEPSSLLLAASGLVVLTAGVRRRVGCQ